MTSDDPSQIQAVLWDMDGVLADTGETHYQSWKLTLDEIGIPFSRETFRLTFGMNNFSMLKFIFGYPPSTDLYDRITNRKETLFQQNIQGSVELFPGVKPWLQRLRVGGYKQAIASSAPQKNIELLVDELGIREYFNALVSAYNLPSKPDPAVFLEAAHRLCVSPERCFVIEDSVFGVEAARRARMRCIAVTNTNPREELMNADLVLNSLLDLISFPDYSLPAD